VRSNRRIEADPRQGRFATLAPSAHAGRSASRAKSNQGREQQGEKR